MAILLVEHDVGLVMAISDEVVVLDFGRSIFRGPPRAALTDDAVRSAYLGEYVALSEPPAEPSTPVTTGSAV
jgi:branched-chain amino acid transport system ATP-binding protein